MADKLILHIGGMKTGTSFLQSTFASNSEELLKCGIEYIDSGNSSEFRQLAVSGGITAGNGIALAKCLNPTLDILPNFDAQNYMSDFIRDVKGSSADSVLVSSEYLSFFLPKELTKFHTLMESEGIDYKIVYYVRSALPFLYSIYSQAVKRTNMDSTFEAYIEKHKGLLRFRAVIAALLNCAPRDNWTIRNYDKVMDQGGIFNDFCNNVLHIDPHLFKIRQNKINRSLNQKELELMINLKKHINTGVPSIDIARNALLSDAILSSQSTSSTEQNSALAE